MSKFIIQGPQQLSGEIAVSGAKNSALTIIPAALLAEGTTVLENVPQISDVDTMLSIVSGLGGQVERNNGEVKIDSGSLTLAPIEREVAGKVRASVLFVGPLLCRFGKAIIGHPGGCSIGRRPIDQFIQGFRAFGAQVEDTGEAYKFSASRLRGIEYFFPFISVTATQCLMMAAVLADGITILKNSACEPEVAALADYLNSCGAKINGAGASTIRIEGVKTLRACEHIIIPDRLETGMFAILAAATKSALHITKCEPRHIEALLKIFEQMGIAYEQGQDWLCIKPRQGQLKSPGKIVTHEYPGFATDLQPPLTVLLTQAEGLTLVHETIFEGRLFYTDLLNRMGANIILCDPHRALVQGFTPLRGKKIESPDIRAGIAMVIAGLIAEGTTTIDNICQIERGYENIHKRLGGLGARIDKA